MRKETKQATRAILLFLAVVIGLCLMAVVFIHWPMVFIVAWAALMGALILLFTFIVCWQITHL